MAVEVKAGETYQVSNPRNGDSWSMFRLKAERGSKEITVFTDDGLNLKDGDRVKIISIVSAKLGARKDRNEKWYDSYTVNVKAQAAGASGGLDDLDDEDGELPF